MRERGRGNDGRQVAERNAAFYARRHEIFRYKHHHTAQQSRRGLTNNNNVNSLWVYEAEVQQQQ